MVANGVTLSVNKCPDHGNTHNFFNTGIIPITTIHMSVCSHSTRLNERLLARNLETNTASCRTTIKCDTHLHYFFCAVISAQKQSHLKSEDSEDGLQCVSWDSKRPVSWESSYCEGVCWRLCSGYRHEYFIVHTFAFSCFLPEEPAGYLPLATCKMQIRKREVFWQFGCLYGDIIKTIQPASAWL